MHWTFIPLGAERKETRPRYLQQYWTSKVRNVPNIIVNTPADPSRSCAIANVGIQDVAPADMATHLLQQYKIYTVAIDYPAADVRGCRITPNIYTLTVNSCHAHPVFLHVHPPPGGGNKVRA